jgi:hypothetical protein
MSAFGDPWKMFGRLLIVCFEIVSYTGIFLFQAGWALAYHRRDKIGDIAAAYGRSVTNAIARVGRC